MQTPPGQPPPGREEVQDHFEDFYEDVFEELSKFGKVSALNVCDNWADHLSGNVYAFFRDENDAREALEALNGRYYAGRKIVAEFSPVTDFREATCRQYEESKCNRGGYCNFMHMKPIGRSLSKQLFGYSSSSSRGRRCFTEESYYRRRERSRSRSRSRSPYDDGDGERERGEGRGSRHRRRDHRDNYHERGEQRDTRDTRDSYRGSRDSEHSDREGDREEGDRERSGEETDEERRKKIAEWNRERNL